MNVLRRFWPIILVALVVAAVVYAFHRRSAPAQTAAPAVQLATVRQGTLDVLVTAHGRVGPPPGSSAALAFAVSGRIYSIDVHVGDRVEVGQPLAQLDSEPFVLAVAQARGDADAASGSLQSMSSTVEVRTAEATALAHQADLKVQADQQGLQRVKTLYAAGISAAKDVLAAQSQLAADEADARAAHVREQALRSGIGSSPGVGQARADVLTARGQAERARAALADAQRNLANATLRAPNAGIVLSILKHAGESVDPTTPVINVGASLQHAATLSVPADQARRISVGDRAQLHVAHSADTFAGKVVAYVPAVDPATQTATVVVSGVPSTALAGDAIDADITVAAEHGLLVPTSAIVQDPQSGDTLVFVATSDDQGRQQFAPRKVQVGAGNQSSTRILKGLRDGERIATEGAFDLLAPAAGSD